MVILAVIGLASAAIAAYVVISLSRRNARAIVVAARAEASVTVKGARMEAAAQRRAAEREAREAALVLRARVDEEVTAAVENLARREERVRAAKATVDAEHDALKDRRRAIDDRNAGIRSLEDRAAGLRRTIETRRLDAIAQLEQIAGESADEAKAQLVQTWLDEACAAAAQRIRAVEQNAGGAEHGREAQRLMGIAVARYQNHFLTERGISNVSILPRVGDLLSGDDARILNVLQEVANVTMHLSDSGESIKLEGLDGVGREVARRALSRLNKKPQAHSTASSDPRDWSIKIREQLDREIQGLGRKAFSVLKIKRAHEEIVTLVGKLNYRTSYTQNQWLHAVEASFLAGIMAEEMGLDLKLARRATLLHDIGKALTHEMDGSHAVIGADIARRLGEDEVVANAIGAHHADEPPSSVYAYLVAAADAMSGARPGARREHTEGYSTRLEDLERIGSSYRGVDRAFAVHGGRELRVYVREDQVSDLDAVDMSSEIAQQISEEMTFPGQIKVTIIRSTEVISVAS